jgi:hypothetical protein
LLLKFETAKLSPAVLVWGYLRRENHAN